MAQTNEAKKNCRKDTEEHPKQGTAKWHMITKTMEASTLEPVATSSGEKPLAIDDVLEVEADSWAGWWGEPLPEWKAPEAISLTRTRSEPIWKPKKSGE